MRVHPASERTTRCVAHGRGAAAGPAEPGLTPRDAVPRIDRSSPHPVPEWWNWQTRTFEGRVGKPMRVRVPPPAPCTPLHRRLRCRRFDREARLAAPCQTSVWRVTRHAAAVVAAGRRARDGERRASVRRRALGSEPERDRERDGRPATGRGQPQASAVTRAASRTSRPSASRADDERQPRRPSRTSGDPRTVTPRTGRSSGGPGPAGDGSTSDAGQRRPAPPRRDQRRPPPASAGAGRARARARRATARQREREDRVGGPEHRAHASRRREQRRPARTAVRSGGVRGARQRGRHAPARAPAADAGPGADPGPAARPARAAVASRRSRSARTAGRVAPEADAPGFAHGAGCVWPAACRAARDRPARHPARAASRSAAPTPAMTSAGAGTTASSATAPQRQPRRAPARPAGAATRHTTPRPAASALTRSPSGIEREVGPGARQRRAADARRHAPAAARPPRPPRPRATPRAPPPPPRARAGAAGDHRVQRPRRAAPSDARRRRPAADRQQDRGQDQVVRVHDAREVEREPASAALPVTSAVGGVPLAQLRAAAAAGRAEPAAGRSRANGHVVAQAGRRAPK